MDNIASYLPTDYESDDALRKRYMKRFVEELFQSKTRLAREAFVERLSTKIYNLLMPHHIRCTSYKHFTEQ